VSHRIDELRSLAEMLDEKKISESEFDTLKGEILETDSDALPPPLADAPPPLADAVKAAREPEQGETSVGWEEMVRNWIDYCRVAPHTYLIALGGGIVALVLSWKMWPLSWLAMALGVLALRETKERKARWMAWVGTGLGFFLAVAALTGPSPDPVAIAPLVTTPVVLVPKVPPEDSLGVRFDTLQAEWNSLELPPSVTDPIRPGSESGTLDSFLHRFDGSAVLAGAYDPETQYLYALLVRAGLNHDDVSNMYVHTCYLLHPGDQGCLDSYIDANGMFGKVPIDFLNTEHSATWVYEGNEWEMSIAENIQTIRIQSPGAG
jgi:hypothetical protein